jgi:lysozyme family protein
MTLFDQVFTIVIGHEGGFTAAPSDPGNWTGGKCGLGICRGTNWGISAASYPDLDIQHLSQADAAAIYQRDYWTPVAGDQLPPPLALLVFDAAVNNGVSRAVRWLQAILGVMQDGAIGPVTLAALASRDGDGATLCAEYLAQRLIFMAALPTWKTFGEGWARRLCALPFQAVSIAAK